jgi:hypothetical protein
MVVSVVQTIPSPDPALGGSEGVVGGQHSMVTCPARYRAVALDFECDKARFCQHKGFAVAGGSSDLQRSCN